MKKHLLAALAALTLALPLTGCKDVMLYLYGGDGWTESDTPKYATYEGTNGVTVVFDENVWPGPNMVQDDTLALTAGNQLTQTTVLLQVTDTYTDFLAQSAAELAETTGTVEYPLDFTMPDAEVAAVRYDCGSYQTVFAQVDYDSGLTVYMTAATKSKNYEQIIELMQNVYPTGHAPENAIEAPMAESLVPAPEGGTREQSKA